MIFKDYYKILGLENTQVTVEEIKQAYREQAKKYHPDINSQDSFSEERFKDVNEAYKILSNSSTKRKYDRSWNNHIGKRKRQSTQKQEKRSIFKEMFQMFFGEEKVVGEKKKNKKVAIKGENIETEIIVSITEAFYGIEKNIALRAVNGKMKQFKVKVPAGIRNDEKIRLIGQGKPGANGGRAGDLLIKVHIEDDKKYKLMGVDIFTNLNITPWEAALGTKVNIEFMDENISLYIPQGTQSGETIRITGKGYLDGKGSRGDLVTNIQIMIPKEINDKEKKIFEQLKNISNYNPRKIYS